MNALNETTEQLDWFTTAIGRRTVYCLPSQLAKENAKEAHVIFAMQSAPSYRPLLMAYHRFRRDLNRHDYVPSVIEAKPWDLLTAHSGVMSAKSARAQTLRRLALAVFMETGLPRREIGAFRGSDGLDWDRVEVAL